MLISRGFGTDSDNAGRSVNVHRGSMISVFKRFGLGCVSRLSWWVFRFKLLLSFIIALSFVSGCAAIRIGDSDPRADFAKRRSDYLTSGNFSAATRSVLFTFGTEASQCQREPTSCVDRMQAINGYLDDFALAVLAELSIAKALEAELALTSSLAVHGQWAQGLWERVVANYLDAARFSYAYLFLGSRAPGERALEMRQTQVRDYYNFAVERIAALIFEHSPSPQDAALPPPGRSRQIAGWSVITEYVGVRLPLGAESLDTILSPSRLQVRGFRNTFRRDGLGAELVARWNLVPPAEWNRSFNEIGFSAATVLLKFSGDSVSDVLAQHEAELLIFDPYQMRSLQLRGQPVVLSANYTMPLALWLRQSGFRREAVLGILGLSEVLTRPQIHLLQPYDPDRLIVVMLHGLASSPQAWAQLANEVLGDEVLRDNFQIWQVQYPTNLPIAINHLEIRAALAQALAEVDPEGKRTSENSLILIGHSMGGVIARMLLLERSDDIWADTLPLAPGSDRRTALLPLEPFIEFEPIEGVGRAIFLAAPHGGTPFAGNWLSRMMTRFIQLPGEVVRQAAVLSDELAQDIPETARRLRNPPTAIHQLDSRNPFLQATSRLNIAPGIPYHSIIARNKPTDAPEDSTDGVVPFISAYLPNADSTLLVESWHSVNRTPEAIVEIRRILHLHLRERAESVQGRVQGAGEGQKQDIGF